MIIDLTVGLNEQTPPYPGDPGMEIKPAGTMEKDGFNDHVVSMGTHLGTHIDAPMHMLPEGVSLDMISIEQFIGTGRCIDVKDGNFEKVKEAGIGAGDIVLLDTGMADIYPKPAYFEDYPVMPEETARYLVDAQVKMVGFDACSADNEAHFPIHKILLGGNVLIIENLTNLDQLVSRNFKVSALPIKLELDAAPARVIAEIING